MSSTEGPSLLGKLAWPRRTELPSQSGAGGQKAPVEVASSRVAGQREAQDVPHTSQSSRLTTFLGSNRSRGSSLHLPSEISLDLRTVQAGLATAGLTSPAESIYGSTRPSAARQICRTGPPLYRIHCCDALQALFLYTPPDDARSHRNGSMLREFLVNEFVLGPKGLGNPAIDGL